MIPHEEPSAAGGKVHQDFLPGSIPTAARSSIANQKKNNVCIELDSIKALHDNYRCAQACFYLNAN